MSLRAPSSRSLGKRVVLARPNGYAVRFHHGCYRCNCVLCAFTAVSRGRISRSKNQKDFFHADANSYSTQTEKICDRKKRISLAFADFVPQKEIRLSIAERVSEGEAKKEILANAGAERNANANTDPFSFVNRDGNSRNRKAWCAERDVVTRSDQWFRELSTESAATSQFGTRTHHTQSGLQVRLGRSR